MELSLTTLRVLAAKYFLMHLAFLDILASNITNDDSLSRQQRHLFYSFPNPPARASWAGGEGYACITSRGVLGSCRSFRNCYPFFKVPPPVARYPVLNPYDTWVLGNYDTCSYYSDDGRQAHGVCCTNPISPGLSPGVDVESSDSEQNKLDLPPAQTVPLYGGWPPPVPTHPPDHTAATHPPSLFGIQPVTTQRPAVATTEKPSTTTWATRPPSYFPPTVQPIFGAPAQTTKRPMRPTTTELSIINDVAFDGGNCGGKNGFQVTGKLIDIFLVINLKLFTGSRENCRWSKC